MLKTFYFATPIFVELLNIMGRLPEYFQNFRKWLSASNKSLKAYWFKVKEKKQTNAGRGVSANASSPSYSVFLL